MKRFPAILLLIAVAAVASGALRYAHDHAPAHDESHCVIHAVLKLPMLGAGPVPVLVLAGLFVAFLTSPPAPVRCRRPVLCLDSRGPPVG